MNRHPDGSVPSRTSARVDGAVPGGLSEQEIKDLVARCPEQQRWAFEGWLRGRRHLDGDPVESLSR